MTDSFVILLANIVMWHSRPLYSMAKGHYHEFFKALETHPKDVTMESYLKIGFGVSWSFKCSLQTYMMGFSSECYFIIILFKWVLPHNKLDK